MITHCKEYVDFKRRVYKEILKKKCTRSVHNSFSETFTHFYKYTSFKLFKHKIKRTLGNNVHKVSKLGTFGVLNTYSSNVK